MQNFEKFRKSRSLVFKQGLKKGKAALNFKVRANVNFYKKNSTFPLMTLISFFIW